MTARSTSPAEGPTPFEHIRDLARKIINVPKKSADKKESSNKKRQQDRHGKRPS